MANEKKRVFASEKANLSLANEKSSTCPNVGTKFTLTGQVCVEKGWVDGEGKEHNTDRFYAYFEGTRNGQVRERGISASVFLRRPFNGFTESEQAQLSEFSKELLTCLDAGELDTLLEKKGIYGGKAIKVESHITHEEVPYGQDKPRKVRYANFVVE